MKAEITASNLYWNNGLLNFFMREQSIKTFEEVVNNATINPDSVLDWIDEIYDDVDMFEEACYELSAEELAEELGIELKNDNEEEE